MKKIILLKLMLSPFENADMDNVSGIIINDESEMFADDGMMVQMIESKDCERNNILILELSLDKPDPFEASLLLQYASALWWRHDRNEMLEQYVLRCVLYDTKPWKILE